MEELLQYIQQHISLNQADQDFVKSLFIQEQVSAKTNLLSQGQITRYLYFLNEGLVKGYQQQDGKVLVEHLIEGGSFFSSFDSFRQQIPAPEYFETVTACTFLKIDKSQFDQLMSRGEKWRYFMQEEVNQHLNCKINRVRDFQTLNARERYEKLLTNHPYIVLHTPVETLASFLGIEPPSLSRIRRQLTI